MEIESLEPQHRAELLRDFTRLVTVDGQSVLEVAVVTWPSPSSPEVRWRAYRRWKRHPSFAQLARAQGMALLERRFFRVCGVCGQLGNIGHLDGDICHVCAERAGVVH